MKTTKLLFWSLAIGIIAASALLCGTAFACDTPLTQSQKLQQLVNKTEGVKDSRVFAYDDCVIVAVRTDSVFLKTAEEELTNQVTKSLQKEYPQYKNVKVTMSLKIFKAIEQINHLIENGKIDPDDFIPKKPQPAPMPNLKTAIDLID